ncbi:hypothetical protein EIP86_010809 [Pleurotus ostreatoroseus]|nr:hypothetical protein EIP86_010809 [Pleurotus ostreatoroseus]
MDAPEEAPLPVVFSRALSFAARAANLPTIEDETQSRVAALSLFSPNETVADISSRSLAYLFVPYVYAEVVNKARTTNPSERLEHIGRAKALYDDFIAQFDTYQLIPEDEKSLYEKKASAMTDPAKRRELKIKQYQKERDLRTRIEQLRKRRYTLSASHEPTSDFELIAALLPVPSNGSAADEDDSDTEDVLRETSLALLALTFSQAQQQLESLKQELELIGNMPPPPQSREDSRTEKAREQDNDMWKLDTPRPSGGPDGKGLLMDTAGRPLRPFTILPPGATDRARLQAQVFQPDHRLPTMTVDEYLEIERQRGNVITGGGPKSEAKLTTSEQLQLDSEMDGTVFAEERAEEQRQKDETWARYKDSHPRGAGNTMNRG